MYSLKVQWDTTLDNWHLCTERQAIYNIHTINSSNEIMYLLEYLLLSLGLTRDIYYEDPYKVIPGLKLFFDPVTFN